MFGFMVTADGGLTTAGYVITVIAGIILFFLAIYFAGKNSDKKKLTTRQLVFCAVAIALSQRNQFDNAADDDKCLKSNHSCKAYCQQAVISSGAVQCDTDSAI